MPRNTYTREFKLQAHRMLTDQGLAVAEVARRLGDGQDCLGNQRQAAQEQGEAAFPGQGHLPAAEDELRRLRVGRGPLRTRAEGRLFAYGKWTPGRSFALVRHPYSTSRW
jgi:transposase